MAARHHAQYRCMQPGTGRQGAMRNNVIPYSDRGRPDGLPVLFIHPLGADQTFWDEARNHLHPAIRSISCNLRGATGTPVPSEPVTLERTAEDIEILRQALGIEEMIVAGCAVGAMAAATYAGRCPARVKGMVLSNPAIEITQAAGANLTMRAEAVRRDGMTALLPDAIENAFEGYLDTEIRRSYQARFLAQPAEAYALAALGVVGASISSALEAASCPVLLIAGGQDRLLPVQQAEKCKARLRNSELVVLARGAHFIPYQEPLWFAQQLNRFVERYGTA